MDEEKLSKDEQTKDDDKVKDDEHEDDTAENEGNTVKKEEKKKHHKKKNKKKGKHHKTRSANSSSENLSIDVGSSRSHSSTADDDGSGSGTPSKTKSKKSKKNKSHKNHKSKHKTPKSEETSGSGASPTQSEDSKLSSYPEADQDIPTDKRPSTGTKPKQEEEKAEEPNANSTASTKKKSSGPDVTGSSSAQKPSTISGSVDVVESVTSDALGKSGTSKTSELSGTGSVKAFGSTQKKSSGSDVAGSSSAQKTSTVSGSVDVVESVTSAALGESGPRSTKKKLSGPEAAGSSVAQKNSSTVSGSVDVVDSVTSAALDKSASASTTKKSSGQEAAGSSVAQKTSTVSGSVDVVQSVASAALGKSGPSKISESKTSKTPRKASSTRDDFLSGKSVDRAIKQDNGKQLKDSAEAKMSQAPRKASSTRDDFLSRESTGQTIDSGGQDTRQHSTTYGSFHTKAEAKGSKTPRKASSTRDDFLSRESTKQSIKVDGVNQSIDSGGQKDRLNSTTYGSFHTKAGADQVVLSKKQSSTSGEKGSVESKHEVLDKLSEISQKRSTDQKKLSETAEGIPSITKADSITEENVPLSLSGEKTSKAGQEVEDVPTIPESGSMLLREKSSTLPGIKTSPAYEAKKETGSERIGPVSFKSQSTNNESLAVESLRGSAANKMSLQHYEEPQDGDFIIPSLEAKEEEYMRYPAVGKTPSEQLGNFEEGDEEQDEEEQLEELNDNVDDEQTEPQQQFLEGDEDLDEEERMEELEDNKGKDEYVEPQQQFLEGEEEEYAENGLGDNKVEDEYVEPQSQVVTGDVLNEERADSESDKDKRDSKRPTKSSGVWEIFRARLSHLRDNIRSSRTLDMFDTDSVIMLVNKVCKGAMRVTDLDEIDCKGNQYYRHDEQLHFRVINYGWNIISLKSLTFPLVDDKFLCVRRDGRLYSDGAMRSNETRFRMHETKDNCVTFESYVEIMHHIAFTKKGTLIPPNKMPKKEECTHFYFIVIRSGEELDTQPQALRYSNF